jgi:hypothetical protein
MGVKISTFLIETALGIRATNQAKKYMEDSDSEYDKAFVDSYYQGVSTTIYLLEWSRIVLLACAFRKRKVCKVYFYFETAIQMLSFLLPQVMYARADTALSTWMQTTLLNLVLFYSSFTPSLIVSFISLVWLQVSRLLIYEDHESLIFIVFSTLLLMLWLAVILGIVHLITLICGDKFTSLLQEVQGSKVLIENFDQGVFVIDQEAQSVSYSNEKARVLEI